MITYEDFSKIDIRVGTILEIQDFPEAIKPAYKLVIDFGPDIGIKNSSVQIVKNYDKDKLIGQHVLAVVNFPKKKIGPFFSEVLTLGVPDNEGNVVLAIPQYLVPNGGKLF